MPSSLTSVSPGGDRRFLPPAIFVGLLVATAAILLTGWLSYRSLEDRRAGSENVTHTLELLNHTQTMLTVLTNAETGQRGFLLTGEEAYLEPYTAASAQLNNELKQLKKLTASNPKQLERYGELEHFVTEKMEELRVTVDLRRAGKTDEALARVRSGNGKRLMDQARDKLRQIAAEEQEVLADRTAESERLYRLSVAITLGGLVVLLLLVVMVGGIVSRDFRARNLQLWLRAAQNGLSERLEGALSLAELGRAVAEFVAQSLGAPVAAFYALEADGSLRRIAGFALDPGLNPRERLALGEGLAGQAARGEKVLTVGQVPPDYLKVSSGTGARDASSLLLMPAVADGVVGGVLELGLFRAPNAFDPLLLEALSEPIGGALRTAQLRQRQTDLLEETQRQAEELQVQQEELKVANEELGEQTEALRLSQQRLEEQQAELEQINHQLEEQMQALAEQKQQVEQAKSELDVKALELQRASQYKSEFLANMSHELRTPLNSALILARLLADNKPGTLNDEQIGYARSIFKAGNDLLALINDVLDVAKIEAGKLAVRPEAVSVQAMVTALEQQFDPVAQEKRVRFSTQLADGVPAQILTDPKRLQQILSNLLSNAFKFTDQGQVDLGVFAIGDGELGFMVRDTGIGIASTQHHLIFEAFRQADGASARKYGGTGLGLSISKDLARLLGGHIELTSAPGKGSTFTLVLPRDYVPAQSDGPLLVNGSVEAALPPAPSPRAPKRAPSFKLPDDRGALEPNDRVLLAVEDDQEFATILLQLAHELGFKCLVATGADEAVDLALTHHPTAIVLDLQLPDHSGFSVLDRLKHNSGTRHIPVQVVSAADAGQLARQMGAASFLLKPVTRERLAESLKALDSRYRDGVRSVLVVESAAADGHGVSALLASTEVKVELAHDPRTALEKLQRSTFDCLVLDLDLKHGAAFELLDQLGHTERYPFPPMIVYSARPLTADEQQRLQRHQSSMVIRGARSPERLLDEVTLFLHQVEARLPPDRQRMLQAARDRDASFEGKLVLLVEDDVRNVFALSRVLETRGAKMAIARNGKEALTALDKQPPDIVLMDIMMPEMDGFTAMRHIRAAPKWSKLPIIALTAKAMPDDHQSCLDAGANDYVAKPIDVEKLVSLIRIWLPR